MRAAPAVTAERITARRKVVRGGARRPRPPRGRPSFAFALPASLFMGAFSVYPLVEMLRMSVSDVGFGNVVRGRWPYVGPDNFRDLLASAGFSQALLNTLVFVAIVVTVTVVGGLAVAVLVRWPSTPRRLAQSVLVFVWTLPPIVTGSAWKFLFFTDGVVNDLLGRLGVDRPILWLASPRVVLFSVAFVNAWAALPFSALVLKAGLLGIPRETEEAAAIDGATAWQGFRRVVLPQLRPVILVLSVLLVVYAFRSFDYIFVMTQGGPGTASTTLPFLAYRDSFKLGLFGQGAATAVIAGLFVVVLAVTYARLTRREEQA